MVVSRVMPDGLRWVRLLPPAVTVRWGDVAAPVAGVHVGWVEVWVAEPMAPSGWLVTVRPPAELDLDLLDDPTVLTVGFDRAVWGVLDDGSTTIRPHPTLSTPLLVPPPAAVRAPLEQAAASPGAKVVHRPGWSTETLDLTLTRWAETEALRPDVTFRFDPDLTPPPRPAPDPT